MSPQAILPRAPFLHALRPSPLRQFRPSTAHLRSVSRYRPPPRYNRFHRAQQLKSLWHTDPRFRYFVGVVGTAGSVFYVYHLERVPVSGRLRFNCVTTSYDQQMAQQRFTQVMQEYRGSVLPPEHESSRLVSRVMERLIPNSGLEGEKWEVRVIDDEEMLNAFVIPGYVGG